MPIFKLKMIKVLECQQLRDAITNKIEFVDNHEIPIFEREIILIQIVDTHKIQIFERRIQIIENHEMPVLEKKMIKFTLSTNTKYQYLNEKSSNSDY